MDKARVWQAFTCTRFLTLLILLYFPSTKTSPSPLKPFLAELEFIWITAFHFPKQYAQMLNVTTNAKFCQWREECINILHCLVVPAPVNPATSTVLPSPTNSVRLGHFTGHWDFVGNTGASSKEKILSRKLQLHWKQPNGCNHWPIKCYHIMTISLFC